MLELSVIIPCLNEEETIGICLDKISKTLIKNNVNFEIIVADNGSTDNSIKIASAYANVKIINVIKKGYGMALRTGIARAAGKYILMGDADNSYDCNDCMKFIEKMRSGFQLVQGCRFPSGGGEIMDGAMPTSHKIFGNPMLTLLARNIYKVPFDDIYCGMRCFEKEIYMKKNYFSEGMTFAVENLIKLVNSGAKTTQVPIVLYKDGRIKAKSHLRTIRDGLLTLKLLLICSPKWLYFYPSILIFLFGLNNAFQFFNEISSFKELELKNYIQIIKIYFILILSVQIFSAGIFTTLVSYQIGLQKNNWVINCMKYFTLQKFFYFLFTFSLIGFYMMSFIFKDITRDLYYLTIYNFLYFNALLLFNGLLISLLELTRFEKE